MQWYLNSKDGENNEIIKIRTEINQIKLRGKTSPKTDSLEIIDEVAKFLTMLTQKERGKPTNN